MIKGVREAANKSAYRIIMRYVGLSTWTYKQKNAIHILGLSLDGSLIMAFGFPHIE
jgi:hypothetical protein